MKAVHFCKKIGHPGYTLVVIKVLYMLLIETCLFNSMMVLFVVQDGIRTLRENADITNYIDSGFSGYIRSHPDFNFGNGMSHYPRRLGLISSSISLTLPESATHIHFSFIEFNIGNRNITQCESTSLTENIQGEFAIYNGLATTLYSCVGGATSPSDKTFQLNNASNNKLIIQLHILPTGLTYNGFLIHYQCTHTCKLSTI